MNDQPALSGIAACVFDAYGTLFDVHSAVRLCHNRLGPSADALSRQWRSKQLEYTWLRALMQRHADFWQVTRDALDYACAQAGINDDALKTDLMDAYLRLDCFADVHPCLQALRRRGIKLAILSNGSPAMLAAVVRRNGLENCLDAVLSVEEVGIYKPSPRVYELAVDRLGIPAAAISFQSANAWDAVAAASFGLRAVWINRFHQPPERLPHPPEQELASLAELPAILS